MSRKDLYPGAQFGFTDPRVRKRCRYLRGVENYLWRVELAAHPELGSAPWSYFLPFFKTQSLKNLDLESDPHLANVRIWMRIRNIS